MCITPNGAPLQCGTLRTIIIHILLEQVEKYSIASARQAKNRLVVPLSNFELFKKQNLQSLPSSRCDSASLHRPTLSNIRTELDLTVIATHETCLICIAHYV
jgi:hypothetical protein